MNVGTCVVAVIDSLAARDAGGPRVVEPRTSNDRTVVGAADSSYDSKTQNARRRTCAERKWMRKATQKDSEAVDVALQSSLQSLQELTEKMGLNRDAEDMPEVGELEMDLVLRMVDLTEALQKAQVESAAKEGALAEARKNTEILADEVAALDSRYQLLVTSLEGQRDRAVAKSVLLEDEVRLLKQEQSGALMKEREEMGERIAELEKSSKEASDLAASLQDSLPQLTAELHELRTQKEETLARNAELAEASEGKDTRIAELSKLTETMASQLKGIDRGLRGLSAALGITEASISSMDSNDVLHQLGRGIDALQERTSHLEEEKSKLQDALAVLESADHGAKDELASEFHSLQAALKEEGGKLAAVENELLEEKDRSASLESQLRSVSIESDSLREEVESLKFQCQTMQNKVEELAASLSDKDLLLQERDELVSELERKVKLKEGSSTEEVKHLQLIVQEKESHLENVVAELKNKDDEIAELSAATNELQNSLKGLQEKVTSSEKQLGDKHGELSELQIKSEEVALSNSSLQSQINELQSTVSILEGQLRDTKDALDTSQGTNRDLLSKVEELKDACRESGSEVSSLKSQLQSSNEELASMKQEYFAQESKLSEVLVEQEERRKEFDSVAAEKEKLEIEMAEASRQCQNYQKDVVELRAQVEHLADDKSQLEKRMEDQESAMNDLFATKEEMEEQLIAASQEYSNKVSSMEGQIQELTGSLNEEKQRAELHEQEAHAARKSLEELQLANQSLQTKAMEAEEKLSSGAEQVALTEKVASEQIAALEEKLELAYVETQRLRESLKRKNEVLGMSKKFLGDILEGKDADAALHMEEMPDKSSNGTSEE
uniref:Uncharacterized protein n=1 Tax=Picocystis salinarum TaxID=88271 RepID=A0A7S3XCF1_9CHLO|mmetsp:Transcript_3719/g.23335  ORF Transcript_3719/g.23335 Transcript_3719/m.23335 type:complete len:845 (-) Transcript_3719:951-3485(-)|eukprot:CAMPEP_0183825874 /NCGR_PEP_ID=MMETSP0807_2-20130328/1384_1 /TAXON_ID=88271 /ORGANISM="Picocystis salinarum, Strain CCMP1897" /LENGTH=844 /DNA_ID=CAMNT_0026070933 /DNA_START=137 /DNA_END=2671 /DNA_ORIENTATION=-